MEESLQIVCEQFLENRSAAKRGFRWEGGMTQALVAALWQSDAPFDAAAVKDARKCIRKNTGIFSSFRGVPLLPFSALLAQESPDVWQTRVDRAKKRYASLREAGFHASTYTALGAFLSLPCCFDADFSAFAARARVFYRQLKKAYPMRVSGEFTSLAILLASDGKSADQLFSETDALRNALLQRISGSASALQLAMLLTLGNSEPAQAADRIERLLQALETRGMRFGRGRALPFLGAPALSDEPVDGIADAILEADACLRASRGFGFWGIGTAQRHMYAAMLAGRRYLDDPTRCAFDGAIAATVSAALIAAQTAAVAAAAAASASASSN